MTKSLEERYKRLRVAAQFLLDQTFVPKSNCLCHLHPPCNDCVENGALRTAVEDLKKELADDHTQV